MCGAAHHHFWFAVFSPDKSHPFASFVRLQRVHVSLYPSLVRAKMRGLASIPARPRLPEILTHFAPHSPPLTSPSAPSPPRYSPAHPAKTAQSVPSADHSCAAASPRTAPPPPPASTYRHPRSP